MPSFVNRQECMDMIDASEVCIPTEDISVFVRRAAFQGQNRRIPRDSSVHFLLWRQRGILYLLFNSIRAPCDP
jgi:hypothetical protein